MTLLAIPLLLLLGVGVFVLARTLVGGPPQRLEAAFLAAMGVRGLDGAAICDVPSFTVADGEASYSFQNGRIRSARLGELIFCPTEDDLQNPEARVAVARHFYVSDYATEEDRTRRLRAMSCPGQERYEFPLILNWTELKGVRPEDIGFARGLEGRVLAFDEATPLVLAYSRAEWGELLAVETVVAEVQKSVGRAVHASDGVQARRGYIATFDSSQGPCVRFALEPWPGWNP